MATAPNFQTPGYFDAQQINRQREMAKLLMQQGQQQPSGQMVSGRYVAPSFFEYLAPVVSQVAGQRKLEKADQAEKELAARLQEQQTQRYRQYASLAGGTPAFEGQQGPTEEGGNLSETTARPAIAPDQAAALNYALVSGDPELRAMALKEIQGEKYGEGEQRIGRSLATGKQEVIASGAPKQTNEQRNYQDAVAGGFKGSFFDYQRELKKAGATNVTATASTERSYGTQLAGKIAEQDAARFETALTAQKRIADADQTLALINKGAITGAGATFRLNVARALNLGGVTDDEKIKNTELLISNRGLAVLSNIKTSGLGAGQGFTDKDRQFLENVVGGRAELNAETLKTLANLEKRAALATTTQWNDRFERMPKEIREASGLHRIDLGPAPGAPGAPGAPAPGTPPPAGAAPGASPSTKQKYDPAAFQRYNLTPPT